MTAWITTANAGGTLQAFTNYHNGIASHSVQLPASISSTTNGAQNAIVSTFSHATGNNIGYQTTCTNCGTYSLYIVLEQLN
jgi:hypothetical protein